MNPAFVGDTISINAQCLKIGKRLAFTTVDVVNKNTGKLVAQGRHTKFINLVS